MPAFSGPELCPTDLTQWRALRSELNHRHEARRMQRHFRQSPESYLAISGRKAQQGKITNIVFFTRFYSPDTIAIGRTGEPVAPRSLSGRHTKVNS